MSDPTYSYLSPVDLATQGSRGWAKLDAVAKAMIAANAMTLENSLSIRQIARITGSDPGNTSRFLKDKPGFVAVKQSTGHSLVGRGYYYAMQFASYGQQQGMSYPKDLSPLMPIAASIPKIVVLPDDPVEISPSATVQPDPLLAGLLPNPVGYVTVPVTEQTHTALVENVSKFLSKNFLTDQPYEALLEIATDRLSDAQLSELANLFGRLSILATSGYQTIVDEINAREVR